ncbi:MAG: hypothetical protein JRN28_00675 [Nitrososphaerota archaeon]|nr:hypothetical protein [Nitrososphaerota archaeon]
MYDVTTLGRIGIDFFPIGNKARLWNASSFAKYLGGPAGNVSIGTSRLGLKSTIVSAISDDQFGQYIQDQLAKYGIETTYLSTKPGSKMRIDFIESIPGEESRYVSYWESSPDLQISENDIINDGIRSTKALVTDATNLARASSRRAALLAMRTVREEAGICVLNLDWRPARWVGVSKKMRTTYYKRAMNLADTIVGNETEFVDAAGLGSIDRLVEMSLLSGKTYIVTEAGKGSEYIAEGKRTTVPAFSINPAKTIGAGDAFTSGIVYALLHAWNPTKMLLFGNAVAALSMSGKSCSDSLPTLKETLRFMKSNVAKMWGANAHS